jgi:hypothetical protein
MPTSKSPTEAQLARSRDTFDIGDTTIVPKINKATIIDGQYASLGMNRERPEFESFIKNPPTPK